MVNRLTIIVSWVYHRHCSVAVSPTVDRIARTRSAGVKPGKSRFWTGTVKPGKTGFWTGTIKTGFWSAIFGCLAWHRWIGGQGISAVFSMQNSCSWTRGSLASKVPRKFKLKIGWNYLWFFHGTKHINVGWIGTKFSMALVLWWSRRHQKVFKWQLFSSNNTVLTKMTTSFSQSSFWMKKTCHLMTF